MLRNRSRMMEASIRILTTSRRHTGRTLSMLKLSFEARKHPKKATVLVGY